MVLFAPPYSMGWRKLFTVSWIPAPIVQTHIEYMYLCMYLCVRLIIVFISVCL